jgi:O-antigen biosynthesis protein
MLIKKSINKNDIIIDVIVLTHNDETILKSSMNLLIKYSDEYNILYFDNGSTDGTKNILLDAYEQNNNVSVVFNDSNLGIVSGRNFAYKQLLKIKKDVKNILFLDSDQYVSAGWVDGYIKMLKEGYDVIGAYAWRMDEKTFFPKEQLRFYQRGEFFNYVGCGGMLIKKEIIDKIGLFDERYNPAYFEDPHFCFLAYQNNYKIGWNADSGIEHRSIKSTSEAKRRRSNFQKSWSEFRLKWAGKKPPVIY